MSKVFLMVSASLLCCATAFAAPTTAKATKKAAVKPAPLICPVTGEKIASVKDAVGSSTYNGKTYYFCCPACKPMFDKNPAKYVKPAGAKATRAAASSKMHMPAR